MRRAALACSVLFLIGAGGCCGRLPQEERVSPEGLRLVRVLDSMHVESHWIAGRHVHWRTGVPDDRPVPPTGFHSHCSTFVAAVASRLGVEILEPPEHPQVLLANAQCEWLADQGRRVGWWLVSTPLEAQRLANGGALVVACYVNPDPDLPGHIAIVRPATLRRQRIEAEGPQITQAGIQNYRSTTLAQGFEHHPLAWKTRAIGFYAHRLPP